MIKFKVGGDSSWHPRGSINIGKPKPIEKPKPKPDFIGKDEFKV